MKRIKMTLTAIAVLGIVGGVLAFKAKKSGVFIYCTTTSTAASAVCVLPLPGAGIGAQGTGPNFKYVTVNTVEDCKIGVVCVKVGRIIFI